MCSAILPCASLRSCQFTIPVIRALAGVIVSNSACFHVLISFNTLDLLADRLSLKKIQISPLNGDLQATMSCYSNDHVVMYGRTCANISPNQNVGCWKLRREYVVHLKDKFSPEIPRWNLHLFELRSPRCCSWPLLLNVSPQDADPFYFKWSPHESRSRCRTSKFDDLQDFVLVCADPVVIWSTVSGWPGCFSHNGLHDLQMVPICTTVQICYEPMTLHSHQ